MSSLIGISLLDDPETRITKLQKTINQIEQQQQQDEIKIAMLLGNHKKFIEKNSALIKETQKNIEQSKWLLASSIAISCLSLFFSLFSLSN